MLKITFNIHIYLALSYLLFRLLKLYMQYALQSAVHKKSAKRRAGKFANPWPLRSKIQHISNIVKRSMVSK